MEKRELVKQFNDLAGWESHPFKKRAYSKAAGIIAAMSDEEFFRRDDYTDIDGIGAAINKKILQFKTTGFIEKWQETEKTRL